jgi:hypothetical protein
VTTFRITAALLLLLGSLTIFPSTAVAERLLVNEQVLTELRGLRQEAKFVGKFSFVTPQEREMMEPVINDLLDRLLAGLEAHPERSWVIEQMMPTVEAFYLEDTELREPCVMYLMRIFRILRIDGPHGAFKQYLLDW